MQYLVTATWYYFTRVTRYLILLLTFFNSIYFSTKEKERKLLLPITSEIKVVQRPLRTRSIFHLVYLHSVYYLTRILCLRIVCISYNKSRSYYERSFYRLLKFSTERTRQRNREKEKQKEDIGGWKTWEFARDFILSSTSQLYIISLFTHINT